MVSIFPKIEDTIIAKIMEKECAIIIGHKNPDGDALSSSIAMSLILRKLNKKTVILNDGPYIKPEIKKLSRAVDVAIPEAFTKENTLVIIVDCATKDRPGYSYERCSDYETVVIDHHASGEIFVDSSMRYIVPSSPSTTLLINEVRKSLGVKLNKEIAYYLYVGLLTDTGFFHFINANVAPSVFSTVTELVNTGLDPYDIYDELNDNKTLDDLKNVARLIDEVESYHGGKILVSIQRARRDGKKYSDEIYAQLLTVRGVAAVVTLKEKSPHITEIGLRSKKSSGIDVGEIASALSGGGHRFASGATVNLPLAEAKSLVLTRLELSF